MKARLSKKIIKASDIYCIYCRFCNTHSRFKYHPYWTKRWHYRSLLKRYPTDIVKSFDQRLDTALSHSPQYMQKILSAIEIKQIELKEKQWAKTFDLLRQFTNEEALKNLLGGDYKIESINKENGNENTFSLSCNKMETI